MLDVNNKASSFRYQVVEKMNGLRILSEAATYMLASSSPKNNAVVDYVSLLQNAVLCCVTAQRNLWFQYITEIIRCVTDKFYASFLPQSDSMLTSVRFGQAKTTGFLNSHYSIALVNSYCDSVNLILLLITGGCSTPSKN